MLEGAEPGMHVGSIWQHSSICLESSDTLLPGEEATALSPEVLSTDMPQMQKSAFSQRDAWCSQARFQLSS